MAISLALLFAVLVSQAIGFCFGRRGMVRPAEPDIDTAMQVNVNLAQGAIQADVRDAKPYIETMCQQIAGVEQDVENGVIAVIEQVSALHAHSNEQIERIAQSIKSGLALSEATERQSEHNHQIIGMLEAQLQGRVAELNANLEHIQGLAAEIGALTPMVEVISTIAKHTNFLALNAAIEAAHAGEAGRGFAVVATEVQKLSAQTAEAAAEISRKISAAATRAAVEVAAASLESQQTDGDLRLLIDDLAAMQDEFSSGSEVLLGVMRSVEIGNTEMVDRLTRVLSHLQFQDVMRQRLQQVQGALFDMNDHLQGLVHKLGDPKWDGTIELSFKQRLENHLQRYVMASQVSTHHAVVGDSAGTARVRPAIELF
jgi:methyl-accepting chemotaxis protein